MKSIMKFGVACVMLLALIGCQALNIGKDDPSVTAVIALAKEICKFEPTASSVAAILAASDPTVAGVAGVTHAICDVVNKTQQQGIVIPDGTTTLLTGACLAGAVNGICVEGRLVE
jgi:hypothetical protein